MRRQLTLEEIREFSQLMKESRVDYLDLGYWLIKDKKQNLNDWLYE